jgi:hypothetical protein
VHRLQMAKPGLIMWPLVRSNSVIMMMMIMMISVRAGVQSESALGTVERRNT